MFFTRTPLLQGVRCADRKDRQCGGDPKEWAGKNPRAMLGSVIVDDVMNARMIAWPFTLLMCLPRHRRRRRLDRHQIGTCQGFPDQPGLHPRHRRAGGDPHGEPARELHQLPRFRVSSTKAFEELGIKHLDVDHLMIYDAFAHLPVWGLEDLGFRERGEGRTSSGANTRPAASCR